MLSLFCLISFYAPTHFLLLFLSSSSSLYSPCFFCLSHSSSSFTFFLYLLPRAEWGSNSRALLCDEVWSPDQHNRTLSVWTLYQFMKRKLNIWSTNGVAPLLRWEQLSGSRALKYGLQLPEKENCVATFIFSCGIVMRPPPNSLGPYSPLRPFTSNQITGDE
jgi:hypothetical protein